MTWLHWLVLALAADRLLVLLCSLCAGARAAYREMSPPTTPQKPRRKVEKPIVMPKDSWLVADAIDYEKPSQRN